MQAKIVIPYVSEEPNRKNPFSPEMEKAAILCLVEARRKRPKILGGAPRKIECVAKVQYPVWGIPWRDRCVIVDGLGMSFLPFSHAQIPNVAGFTEALVKSKVSYIQFRETLAEHKWTFRHFTATEKESIDGLVSDNSVLNSLQDLITHALNIKDAHGEKSILIPPNVLEGEANEIKEKFEVEWQKMRTEISALSYALDALKRDAETHQTRAMIEIEHIQREYAERIARMKEITDGKIARLTEEKLRGTKSAAKLQEEKLSAATREEKKVQKKIERFRHLLEEHMRKLQERYETSKKKAGLDAKAKFYKEELKKWSRESNNLSNLKKKIRRDAEKAIKAIEKRHDAQVAKEVEKIKVLEDAREQETTKMHADLKKMAEDAVKIEQQIEQLMEHKNESLKILEGKTLLLEIKEPTLIGIPLYLAQYKMPKNASVDVYPPVTAADYEGIVKRIQKAVLSFILEARIQLLLNPRSKPLDESFFEAFKSRLRKDAALRESIHQLGRSSNLLAMPNIEKELTEGLNGLVAEGWISTQERDSMISIYVSQEG